MATPLRYPLHPDWVLSYGQIAMSDRGFVADLWLPHLWYIFQNQFLNSDGLAEIFQ